MAIDTADLDSLPYYIFKSAENKRYLEGRFWNQGGEAACDSCHRHREKWLW